MPEADDAAAQAAAEAKAAEDAKAEQERQAAAGRETRTAEELAAELSRVNAESAGRRKKLEEFETAEAERKRKELGEAEGLKKDITDRDAAIADLQRQVAQRDLKDDVTEIATRLGFRNPALASRLVDLASVTDDAGKIDKAKVEKALKDELKANEYLGGQRSNDGGARDQGGVSGKTDMNQAIRRASGRGQ